MRIGDVGHEGRSSPATGAARRRARAPATATSASEAARDCRGRSPIAGASAAGAAKIATAMHVQRIEPEERRRLHQDLAGGQRVADRVPRESRRGGGRAAIRRRRARREREDAPPVLAPEELRQRPRRDPRGARARPAAAITATGMQPARTRPPRRGTRRRPTRGRRGNSRSRTTSRPRRPGRSRRTRPLLRLRDRAVDQPDEDRKGDPEDREGEERRLRQRRKRARREGYAAPAPAPGQDDRICQAIHGPRRFVAADLLTTVADGCGGQNQGNGIDPRASGSRREKRERPAIRPTARKIHSTGSALSAVVTPRYGRSPSRCAASIRRGFP